MIKSLAIYWIKVREFWVLYRCVLHQFSVFPTHTRAHFSHELQKITKCFQHGYKIKTKLKHRTHYTIFQNRRICASCQLYGLVHYAAYTFSPIYMVCGLRLWVCGSLGCLYGLGLYGRLGGRERRRV